MTSPMLTVLVLAVLWLIVVVPMIVRRHDNRAHERSVEQFGRSMRALTRRHVALSRPAVSRRADVDDTRQAVRRGPDPRTSPRSFQPRPEPYVPGARAAFAPSMRRPVPAAEEALMYPVDRTEMSPARMQMMARRRRSLTILTIGSVASVVLAAVLGGVLWVPALLFLAGLGGYVYFLRSQVLRDRERREARQMRASARGPVGWDVTEEVEAPLSSDSTVRIDDDDPALHDHDTIDLTGLYAEEAFAQSGGQRRAS